MLKKTLTFTQRMVDNVEEIQEIKGYPTFSSVITQAVIELHSKLTSAYARPPAAKASRTAEEKAKEKYNLKEAERQIIIDKQINICKKLGGKVVDSNTGGQQACHYNTYQFRTTYGQEIPLSMLSEDMIPNQYYPSKQRVEDLQAEEKSKTKKNEKR